MHFRSKLLILLRDVGEPLKLPSEYMVREYRDKKISLRNTVTRNYMSAILQYRSQESTPIFLNISVFLLQHCFKWTFFKQLFIRQGRSLWIYWNFLNEEYSQASLISQTKNYKNESKLEKDYSEN